MDNVRALYKNDVDFEALALQSPEFAKHLKQSKHVDFNDPVTVRQLTISLLQRDFGLEVKLPEDRLCPPVPNRLNYIIWLQDLLDSTTGSIDRRNDMKKDRMGLDIGTGCCSIYPLLGCKTRLGWKFLATDIDKSNIQSAQDNVKLNKLESRIRILQTDPNDSFFPLDKFQEQRIDFTMCNPPFYASQEEMTTSAEGKSQAPNSICTGAEVEMITPGGEAAFVTRMVDDSLQTRDQIQWYTSMLGKLSSVTAVVDTLMKRENKNYAVTEFVQGNKTKRWAVAWSWSDMRPSMSTARGIPGFPKHLLPFPSEFPFELPLETTFSTVVDAMNKDLNSLSWTWTWDKNLSAGIGFASENVWSRQARRKGKLAEQQGTASKPTLNLKETELGVRVQLSLARAKDSEAHEIKVLISWIQGTDHVLFESFCGMLKRKLETK
ncbi:hypothetical protein N7456_004945 [Penicillium angulare]|uniref:U6 small nuclear RNA (adenine-(43)-N(6))-methyltransferase n=1 Tax=Penicillium angulare TaxID=116970 RepID=A0A9W9KJ30_9EURO|nr:hypothetical protein N7456_004945 [Penicillium angulare]